MFNKKGFISIYTILWITVLFPILMFVAIDLSYFLHEDVRLKAITDNACNSAVTMLNKNKIPEGILEISNEDAENAIKNILIKDLILNNDLSPTKYSNLNSSPNIIIQVYNDVPSEGRVVNIMNNSIKLKHPSIILYVEYPVKGLFFKNLTVPIKKIAVSQVQYR